jgi:hypothetical protein
MHPTVCSARYGRFVPQLLKFKGRPATSTAPNLTLGTRDELLGLSSQKRDGFAVSRHVGIIPKVTRGDFELRP